MDIFPIAEVRDQFESDMLSAIAGLRPRIATLAGDDLVEAAGRQLDACNACEDGCHTITGSSSLVGAQALAGAAGDTIQLIGELRGALTALHAAAVQARSLGQRVAAAVPGFERLLVLELDQRRSEADQMQSELRSAPDSFDFADEIAVAVAPVTPVHEAVDPLVREVFAVEAGELLDALDRVVLAWEAGQSGALAELERLWHTLKGTANTVGMNAIGRLAHRAEDALDAHTNRGTGTDPALVGALIRLQQGIRTHLAGGPLDESDLAASLSDRQQAPGPSAAHTLVPIADVPAPVAAHPPQTMRVAAEQLDTLMGLAGELVQERARIASRAGILGGLQRELRGNRERLATTIATFRERHEYGGLDGRRPQRSDDAIGGRFSDLELDRYEDIHILSRSLGEIDSDIHELQRRMDESIGAIGEESETFARVVGGLQGEITRARMVPVDQLFTRLRLAVRDAGERLARPVQVQCQGEEVALDRGIVDGIAGALLHLVRNAVAHGIEERELRLAAGKPGEGSITLAARQESGQIVLEVRDDGAGLDLAALRQRGAALGLIGDGADDQQVAELVFAPGLSTSAGTDAVSGRGIGCDVARRGIQRLGGTLGVRSNPGLGTVFTAVLPLTLAITRALLIRQGGQSYAVPMAFIEHILDLDTAETVHSAGGSRLLWNDCQLPLRGLDELLEVSSLRPAGGPALILRLGERRWALRVDALVNQTDIVVNSLGELLAGHPLFSGVTLTGAGALVPILDIAGLEADPGRRAAAGRRVPVASGQVRQPKVLFVDDSLSVRRTAEAHLRALGVEPVLAVDSEEALACLRQGGIDLVFTDLEMPRLHGYDLIRALRQVPAWSDLPVVVVTSRSGDKHRQLAQQVGASAYLTKPFSSEALASQLVAFGILR